MVTLYTKRIRSVFVINAKILAMLFIIHMIGIRRLASMISWSPIYMYISYKNICPAPNAMPVNPIQLSNHLFYSPNFIHYWMREESYCERNMCSGDVARHAHEQGLYCQGY